MKTIIWRLNQPMYQHLNVKNVFVMQRHHTRSIAAEAKKLKKV